MARIRNDEGKFQRIPTADRFWEKVAMGSPEECWPWQGPIKPNGYGYTTDFWKKIYAHRFAYEQENGPIPPGLLILHSCDNPACVNPSHLRAGTHQDNMDDMETRGRSNRIGPIEPLRGERAPNHVLTETQVREIRRRYVARPPGRPSLNTPKSGPTIRELAAEYGVSSSMIHSILKNRTWAHVANPISSM